VIKATRADPPPKKAPAPRVTTETLTGVATPAPWLKDASRVAGINTKAGPRIVAAGTGWLRLFDGSGKLIAEAKGIGGANVLEVFDATGDGVDDIIIGRGMARGALDIQPSLTIYQADLSDATAQTISLPTTQRAQVIAVEPASDKAGDLWVATFDSKYMVSMQRALFKDGKWNTTEITKVRVAGDIASVTLGGKRVLVVARMYGDTADADGDVYIVGGTQQKLPSTRGARALVSVENGVVMADGWHKQYGTKAEALLTLVRKEGGRWVSTRLAKVPGRHGYNRLRIGDIDGDKQQDVIAAGNGPAVAVTISANAEAPVRYLSLGEAADAYPFDVDGDGSLEVIIAGSKPAIWHRR